jgi:hypothetical protein
MYCGTYDTYVFYVYICCAAVGLGNKKFDNCHVWEKTVGSCSLYIADVQHCVFVFVVTLYGARGGAVGRGITLQAGRSRVRFLMVSLEFFIDIILPAALWP